MTRSESITKGSGEHAKRLYSVGKKTVDQVARANSGRALTSETTVTMAGMLAVDPEGGDSFFMLGSVALVFDAADFVWLGAADCLMPVGLGLVRDGAFGGVGTSLSGALSTRTS